MKNNLPVTKDDLKSLATKEELNAAVAKLATKEELAQTERILRAEIRQSAEDTKDQIRAEIKESTSTILNVFDDFMAEIKASREEREIVSYRLSDHEQRLTKLETNPSIPTPA